MSKKIFSFIKGKYILCLAIVFIYNSNVFAQYDSEKGLPFITNYLPKNYKALPQTWCVIEDNQGIMYFGIQNGVLEYDGVKWRKIKFEKIPPVVRALAKDKYGKIYYGAIGDFGYFVHDSLGQTVAKSLLDLIPKKFRNFYDVWTIHVASEGIYFQSREYIFRINEKNQVQTWKPNSKFMYSFYLDDNYYVHEQGLGLYKMIKDSLQFIKGSEFLGKERLQVMLPFHSPGSPLSEKKYLVGLFYSGLYVFDGKKFEPFKSEATPILTSGTLYKGVETKDGFYALSTTGKGLVIIDASGKLIKQINRDVGLQDESVYAVYADSKGMLWLALDNGISRVETATPLTQFTNQAGINTATLSIQRFNDDLYLGTTNGLMVFDRKNSRFIPITQIPPNQTFSLLKDGNSLLIANDGLFAVENKKVKLIQESIGGNLQITGLLLSDKYPVLYAGSPFGVEVFVRTTGGWKSYGLVPGLEDQIWTFSENPDGSLWVGTQNNTFYKLTTKFNSVNEPIMNEFKIERFGEENGLKDILGSVFKIKGETYFPADTCIYKYNHASKRFVKEDAFGSFPNGGGKDEFFITEDKSGRVWIRFGKETVLAIPQPDGKYRLDKTSLLPIGDRSVSTIYPEDNGIVWICTTDGLVRFDERVQKNYDAPFSTILRHITAGSSVINPHSYDSIYKAPSISYKNSSLRFEYAAPFFEQEDKTQYQTWLEGFEETWSGWDNNYYKEYTNLPEGNYKFHVRSMNVYHKPGKEAVFTFTILPPWWRTWWAYAIYALLALGTIYSLIRWRTRQLHEKHRELERIVDERTYELSHRLKELAVINSVQDGLVREMDMDSIYEMVGEKIREIFNAQVIDIVTYDKVTNLMEDKYAYEKGDRTLVGTWEPEGFRKHVIETGEVLCINKNLENKAVEFNSKVIHGELPKSAIWVPLITGNEVKGMISLQDIDKENAFAESDIRLLTTLGNSMSVALESVRRFDETNRLLKETEQRNAELAVINSVQESLVAQLDIKSIYELVGEKIRNIFDAQVIDIVTYNPLNNIIEDQYAYEKGDRTLLGPREAKGFRKHVIETGEVLLTNENVAQASIDYDNPILIGDMPKSQVYVPMIAGGKVKGIISLQNLDHEHAFPETNVSLLITLANSMSVALESARLFDETTRLLKETGQRNAELAVITSVQESLVAQMDMQGIYELVGEKMREIFNAQVIDIVTYDKATGLIEDRYAFEKGDRTLLGKRAPKGFRKHVITEGQLLVINKDVEKLRPAYDNTVVVGEPAKSLVMVPMVVGGEVTGVISLQNVDQENAFSDSDINLLNTLVNSMSVALKSARLFDETVRLLKETEQRTAELAVINSVQEGLAKELDMNGIYDLVGDRVQILFKAQVVLIATFDAKFQYENFNYVFENNEKVSLASREINYLRRKLITDKQTIYIKTEQQASQEFGLKPIEKTDMPKSLLFVPLVSGTDVRGYVSLQNIDQENAFSESDVRLLETLANSMSVALENARLFDETNRLLKETEQRTAELAVINSVQEGLVREMDMQAIYELVGNRLCNLFPDTQTLVIRTFDHASGNEQWQYAIEKGVRLYSKPRPFNWANQRLINTMQPLHINKDYVETAKKYGGTGVTKGTPPKSAVFVPMVVGDVVKGSVSLQNIDIENAFTESDVRLLTTLTNSMSVALENARLFDETHRLLKETEQRTAELAVINSVQEGLVKEIDMQAIYETVGDRLCELFNTQTVLIRTFDHDKEQEVWRYVKEKGERFYSDPRPYNWANKQLISSRRPLIINKDYVETAKKYGGSGVSKGLPPKSAVFVPMIVGDVVKGSVSLQNIDIENAFSEADIRLLTTLTNSMSVALENARLFDETNRLLGEAKQRASELTTVNNISKAIASQLNPNDLIQLVGEQLKNLFNANIVYLALLDQKTQTIYFPYQFGDELKPMKLGEGLTSQIILTGDSLLINRNIQEFRKQLGVAMLGIPAASYLGVPIPVGDEYIGVLSVQSTEQENRFNENDKRLLSTIAASVGVALRNAKLFEDVQLAKNEAEAASKAAEKANEAKSAFLSTVSHELRTPLTSVLGFTKIIRKRLDEKIFPVVNQDDPKTGKVISQINENLNVVIAEGERLTHLINDVLDLAKIEAGKMEWNMEDVSMTEVAERAIAATSSLFETKPLKLVKHIDDDLPKISGDRDKLIQVIINLISNSVKFTDSGTVSCNIYQKKNELIVEIEDTGIGIAKEDFDAVFEQFKQVGGDTLTDKPKGTGLGLPICKEIIEHHGGRIWLESKVGEGSKFSFALPVVNEEKRQPLHLNQLIKQLKEQMNYSPFKAIGTHSTILVVDDDDSIRSLLNQELTEAGYTIEEAGNGKEALEKIRKKRPDLIILDVMMPEMNGFDVAAILKNDPSTMDIPIIVLSIVQDKARGFRIGVDRYLTKPINTAELFTEVGSLLDQGKSKRKVLVVDEDSTAVRSLSDVLEAKGYNVVESDETRIVQQAIDTQPDIIILNSVKTGRQELMKTIRFEKGLENVLFLMYQ